MLQLSDVTIALEDKPILQNLSLTIRPGTVHALMGPNGSGKSTLALTLMGHPSYAVVSGSLLFNNEDIVALPVEKRARAGLFLICQQPPAIPGVQLMTFLKEAHRMLTGEDISVAAFKERVRAAFDAVKLDESFLYRTVHDGFSGGEKKRFEIAQLLLFKPKLAILDEIDSGLDVDGLVTIAMAIKQAQKDNPDMSLLMITHYNRILEFIEPDYVHVLAKGKLCASGDNELAKQIEQNGYAAVRPELVEGYERQ